VALVPRAPVKTNPTATAGSGRWHWAPMSLTPQGHSGPALSRSPSRVEETGLSWTRGANAEGRCAELVRAPGKVFFQWLLFPRKKSKALWEVMETIKLSSLPPR
jgi:hypothetical protein